MDKTAAMDIPELHFLTPVYAPNRIIVCRRGLCLIPHCSLQRSPGPLSGFKGSYLLVRGRKREGEGRDGMEKGERTIGSSSFALGRKKKKTRCLYGCVVPYSTA